MIFLFLFEREELFDGNTPKEIVWVQILASPITCYYKL